MFALIEKAFAYYLVELFSDMIYNLNRVDVILVGSFAESLCEIQKGIAFWIFRTAAHATWWYIFLIGHAVLQSEVEQNFRFGWLNQKLFREMKFYVFPRKWNDIYFSISMKDSSRERQEKHKEQVNEQMCVSFIQRTLKLLKDNFSSLTTTTTKKTLISKWADGYSKGRAW